MLKRVLVDMSLTLVHVGHIRLLKKASILGHVIVGLVSDNDILKTKGFMPEMSFEQRKEIALAIRYVGEVIETDWLIDDNFMKLHNIDLLVHGDDNINPVSKDRLVIFPRTKGISSSALRNSNQN